MNPSQPLALPGHAHIARLCCAGLGDPLKPLEGPVEILVKFGAANDLERFCAPLPLGSSSRKRLCTTHRTIEILAAGRSDQIASHPAASHAHLLDLSGCALVPGLVNAHTHLDLTHLGPMPHDPAAGFVAWVDRIRDGRATESEAIRASVGRGVTLSLAGGVVAVGDIAGAPAGLPSLDPLAGLADSPLRGVSFLEFFAIGSREQAALDRLESVLGKAPQTDANVRLGLEPHAPNTVGLRAYIHACALARVHTLPLTTHLAESAEEHALIAQGVGSQRELLERFGLWDAQVAAMVGHGLSPIAHLEPVLTKAPFVLAHVNDCSDADLAILAASDCHIAYCPRASLYFHAADSFGPHRYREMLGAGMNVCLGTDSIVNLPQGTDASGGRGMGILDEARLLFARDGTDPALLLAMATINGWRALGFSESLGRLTRGARPAGLGVVDIAGTDPGLAVCERLMRSAEPCRLLCLGIDEEGT